MKIRARQLSVRALTWIVARDVNRTLGGGLASMELLRRTFVSNGILDDQGNAGLVAVSRLTPGTNVLAYCTALGWSLRAWAGALAALLAASLPASIIVFTLTTALVRIHANPVVQLLLAVGVAVATGLVFASAWALLRPYLHGPAVGRAAIVAALTVALLVADVTPVRILLASAAVGAVLGVPARSPGPG